VACAAHGLPIVSTLPVSAAVADAVHTVAAHDPRALAAATLEVARNEQLEQRLRAGSAELAERTSWPRIAQRHLEVYREVGWHGR
jgi:glycosyltransferase involved in cell wall biosynthesis